MKFDNWKFSYRQTIYFVALFDEMAKWLRKLYANPLDSDGMVSNPVFVMLSVGCIVKWLAIWTLNPAIWVQF